MVLPCLASSAKVMVLGLQCGGENHHPQEDDQEGRQGVEPDGQELGEEEEKEE